MIRKVLMGLAVACSALLINAQPAHAQQTVNLTIGYFSVRGEDARVADDVLNANRNFLTFDVKDMSGPIVGAEWLIPLGGYFEAGAGVAFSRRTVPTFYSRLGDSDGTDIDQDLRLRTVPVSFTFRVLPFGQHTPIQPYVGAGLGVISWRYSESGEFVGTDRSVFRASYVKSGSDTGPVALGGIRFASDSASAGFEVRYQKAEGDLPLPFAGSKIDLGGWVYQFTVGARFGR